MLAVVFLLKIQISFQKSPLNKTAKQNKKKVYTQKEKHRAMATTEVQDSGPNGQRFTEKFNYTRTQMSIRVKFVENEIH